jgi:hypothetical protein
LKLSKTRGSGPGLPGRQDDTVARVEHGLGHRRGRGSRLGCSGTGGDECIGPAAGEDAVDADAGNVLLIAVADTGRPDVDEGSGVGGSGRQLVGRQGRFGQGLPGDVREGRFAAGRRRARHGCRVAAFADGVEEPVVAGEVDHAVGNSGRGEAAGHGEVPEFLPGRGVGGDEVALVGQGVDDAGGYRRRGVHFADGEAPCLLAGGGVDGVEGVAAEEDQPAGGRRRREEPGGPEPPPLGTGCRVDREDEGRTIGGALGADVDGTVSDGGGSEKSVGRVPRLVVPALAAVGGVDGPDPARRAVAASGVGRLGGDVDDPVGDRGGREGQPLRVEAPALGPGRGIEREETAPWIVERPGAGVNDAVDDRRRRVEGARLPVRLEAPAKRSGPGVERVEAVVAADHHDPLGDHRVAEGRDEIEAPELSPGRGVRRQEQIRLGVGIDDAVDYGRGVAPTGAGLDPPSDLRPGDRSRVLGRPGPRRVAAEPYPPRVDGA